MAELETTRTDLNTVDDELKQTATALNDANQQLAQAREQAAQKQHTLCIDLLSDFSFLFQQHGSKQLRRSSKTDPGRL